MWLKVLRERGFRSTPEVLDRSSLTVCPGFRVEMGFCWEIQAVKHAVRFGPRVSCLSRRVIAEQLSNVAVVGKIAEHHSNPTLFRIYHRRNISPTPSIPS